jgi:hypothetical protein
MPPYHVSIVPRDFVLAARVERSLRSAVAAFALGPRLRNVTVRLHPRLGGDDAHVRWHRRGSRVDVRLDVDLGNFLTARSRRRERLLDARTPAGCPRVRRPFPARRWSERGARATFLHEMTHVADELFRGIDATHVDKHTLDSFHEAWNVWIDGRLARRGSAALPRRERWREFRRAIGRRASARRGAVRAFDRLWGARRLRQHDLVDVVERLLR